MTVQTFFDPPGPRARRRYAVVEVVVAVVVLGGLALAARTLFSKGEFSGAAWGPFAQWGLWRLLALALLKNIQAAVAGMILSLAIGCLLAFGLLATHRVVRLCARIYVDVFASIPLLLLLYFTSLVLPSYGLRLGDFWFLVIALTLYSSAVVGDLVRAGIVALPAGQSEAAAALGFSRVATMRLVLLPQALRSMSPALVSQMVILFKGTALAYVLGGYLELLRSATVIGQYYSRSLLQTEVIAALGFMVINIGLSALAGALERREGRRSPGEPVNPLTAEPAQEPVAA